MSKVVEPQWPELSLPYGVLADTHIAANTLVRSSMFSTLEFAGAATRPSISVPLPLEAIAPYRVIQVAGMRLSQSDADLFYWLLSRAYRDNPPKGIAWVFFKRAEAFAALARARGGKTDILLDASVQRLCDATFHCEYLGVTTPVTLLARLERFEDGSKPYDYKVSIGEGVAMLLDGGEWLTLSAPVRAQLSQDPLAKGLHAFYASHRTAFPMLPSRLKALMGRESMQDSKWQQALVKALARVREAAGWVQCEVVAGGKYAGKVIVHKGARPAGRKRGVPDAA